ncbi:MAG: hypothetical protein FJY75_11125 [Candidatus Eisenbacteria bacterium]|uniref:Lipoyl-binding domain-containing protein n=1 Tax=Eiseniibacteriota bacterium TaxID=2212470 RepID=A0A938BS27_UNCEI|nr:hypothetical protein [Candidatus Eisenbacteria bacterium]
MERTFKLRIDGREFEIERRGSALLVDGQRFDPRISGTSVALGDLRLTVEVDGPRAFVDGIARAIETEGLDEKPADAAVDHGFGADAGGAVTAVMPGLIIRVAAVAGDAVKTGDVVVVLEAMKMENDICSPRDGVIKEIRVQAGDTVQQNQLLALVE